MSAASSAVLSRTVALVTGGSSGLGAAATKYLLRNGARVVVADVDVSSSRESFVENAPANVIFVETDPETGRRLRGSSAAIDDGPAVTFVVADVTSENQVSRALDAAESCFGEPVNALIGCAGVAVAKKTLSNKTGPHPLEDFVRVLSVNSVGTFNVARLAAERMSRREADDDNLRGCIIHTASIAAYEGQIGQVAYAASKGAVVGMTLPMARELAPYGIRVMTIVSAGFAILRH